MSWQAVGSPQSFTYVAKDIEGQDLHSFRFNGDEGNVTVHYRIFSKKLPGPQVRVRVQFDELEVHDDEEIGSGDWRIKTSTARRK